jgi:hypothetical protein
MRRTLPALLLLAVVLVSTNARAQGEARTARFQENCERSWNNDRARFCETRDFTLPATSRLSVDGRDNGGVAFYGWDRSEVKVVALIQTSADDDATARDIAKQIRVVTEGGKVHAEGPAYRRHTSWSVSYQVYVPRLANLEALTENGGISADGVRGEMNFEASNGGIHLADVGGNVRARTTNGGVTADLSGTSWQGQGLDLQTTNGGATVNIPRGYNARLETGTTNGGMNVDFPITVRGAIGRRISTQLGSGGPLVRVITTNGGVHVSER